MSKTIEYYISKGFDEKTANYFGDGRKTITGVIPNDDFTLVITFDNSEVRILDLKPILKPGTVFEPFMDIKHFKRVYVDDTNAICWDINPDIDSNIVWSNKVDLCPDTCYLESIPKELYNGLNR